MADSPPKVTSPCGCGHARLMHGDLVWDTACRECNCARYYERWCCDKCAAEGWQCPAFCGRPCCEAAVVARIEKGSE